MKKNKSVSLKVLTVLLAAMLLLGVTIGGTVAWLMNQTEPVVNTFVAGNISIKLEEHVLDVNTGKWQSPEAFTASGNQNILAVPGRVIQKDPTVTVLKGSEKCYVRVFVKISWPQEADSQFAQFEYSAWFDFDDDWSIRRIFDGSYATNGKYVGYDIYELRYSGVVDATGANVELPVLHSMTVPGDLDNDAIAALNTSAMTLVAQAVQAETFADADAAFAAAGYPEGWAPATENP